MTDRYVDPAVASSGVGTSWATAYKTLKEATDAAAAGEKIYFHNGTADVITVSTTYTLATGVAVISTSDNTNNPPTTYAVGATLSSVTSGVDITVNGLSLAFYGIYLKAATTGGSHLSLGAVDNSSLILEDCLLSIPSTNTSYINLGYSGGSANTFISTRNCTWAFGATGSSIGVYCAVRSDGDTFCATGSIPIILFNAFQYDSALGVTGADLSNVSSTLVSGSTISTIAVTFSNCKLHASVTMLGATLNAASNEVSAYDCAYDNAGTLTGLLLYHENYLGSTTISTSVYANDNPTYDGTAKCSWVVDGKAVSNLQQPYVSPWINVYNADVSTSITPYFEALRSGSTTAYTNAEVWAEFEYRDTANSPKFTLVHDMVGPLATAANQTSSSKAAGDWTGEHATDNWFGKLEAPTAFTPDEVGYMRARICVAGDNTVYIDPQIRGLA